MMTCCGALAFVARDSVEGVVAPMNDKIVGFARLSLGD
jgi:hypothetical protein